MEKLPEVANKEWLINGQQDHAIIIIIISYQETETPSWLVAGHTVKLTSM